nr:ribonuclease H-like domain-containing protein [Tanacetum cinerariifolium]
MEAHLALMQPSQVKKITTSCEFCSGPYDTQYFMEDPEQSFVEYASSRTDEARASQDARLSKFEADFKQQQSEMTNKIDTVLKAITDQMAGALPRDTVKNPKLNINTTTSERKLVVKKAKKYCNIQYERERIMLLINKLGMQSFTLETLKQLADEVEE